MISNMSNASEQPSNMQDVVVEPSHISGHMQRLQVNESNMQGRSHSPELQMPQPFTPRSTSPDAMLPQREPDDSPSSPPAVVRPMIVTTPPRLHSSASNPMLGAAPMIRAHSSPAFSFSPILPPALSAPRSTSPLRSPKRARSPFRHSSLDEGYVGSGSSMGSTSVTLSPEISSIFEDQELEIQPRGGPPSISSPSPSFPSSTYASLTFPRPRRRPASPLKSFSSAASPILSATGGTKFNEAFPTDLPYYSRSLSSSSVPSTPTSTRSRSPSISSLETIPDTPDAEMLAVEEDRRDRDDRRRYWDLSSASVSPANTVGQLRPGFGNRDKRKRWSVCGAEKRGDLNLETIWED